MTDERILAASVLLGTLAGAALGQSVPVDLVAIEGDEVAGSTISTLNAPFTNGVGEVSFVGNLADGTRIIWLNDGPIFHSPDALPDVLTGGEGTHGVSDDGQFVYSPSFNGDDAAYSSSGLLLKDGDPAPGLPGVTITFCSRPTMLPGGTAYWVSGSTVGDVLYRCPDVSDPGTTVPLLVAGDIIDGFPVDSVEFGYWVSDDGAQHIQEVKLDTGSTTNDDAILVNGVLVAREASPNGDGDNWDNFDNPCISSTGTFLFTGDTDGDAGSDEFLAIDGVIRLREGDTVDGRVLDSAVNAASINDDDQIAFIWTTDQGETLFFGPADDPASSVAVLWVGAVLDCPQCNDWEVTDFNASNIISPGLDLAEDGRVFVEIDAGPDELEAIVAIALPSACPADVTGDGVVDVEDLTTVILGWGGGGPGDVNDDGVIDVQDLTAVILAWGECP